jgi:hypothetical protein
LVHIVSKLFSKSELQQLVFTKLEFDLFDVAASGTDPLQSITYDLCGYLNRHGFATEFLNAICEARPRDEGLLQFASRVRGIPGVTSFAEQVGAFGTAIQTVTAIAQSDPKIRETVGISKAQFKVVRAELDRLARYKSLHDCLHTLELQLSAIARAARAFPVDAAAGRDLIRFVDELTRRARRARKNTTGLFTEAEEIAWVDEFDQALGAAREAIRALSAAPLVEAVEALGRLLPEASRINVEMIGAASRLGPGLDELAKTLRDLSGSPAAGARPPDEGVVGRIEAGAQALQGLMPQLAGFASTHDAWQRIDTALSAAASVPDGPPSRRVPRWPQIKKLLARVCPAGSSADPEGDPLALADQWEQAADADTAENLFLTLRATSQHEFKGIDDQLLELADQLTVTVGPLDILLRVI